VLENIQTIKQKATTQVKQLNDENNLLREEILQMESCIEKLTKMVKEQAESIKDAE
jgi:septal ring factor EnvC (AmiA/AmiB activator)